MMSGDKCNTLAGLPPRASLRERAHNRSCAFADRPGLRLLPKPKLAADAGREAVTPSSLDQQPAGGAVASLGKAAAFDTCTARMLRWHQSEISHQLTRIGKTREVAQFGDQRCRIDQGHAAHRLQRRHDRRQRPIWQHRCDLCGQPIASVPSGLDCLNVILEHDMMHCLLELEPREPSAM